MPVSESDNLLVQRVRGGDPSAWEELISRFEGRILAYVAHRTRNRSAAEDVVQETFIGFLTSLPNYDSRRSLESYLFSIAAHKLTDHLRREGRRPTLPMVPGGSDPSSWDPPGPGRAASSIVRSLERKGLEESAIVAAVREQLAAWELRDDWEKVECVELIFVRGLPNKEVALRLGLSEQTVANHKFEFIAKLRGAVRRQNLPDEVFPELYQDG